MKKVLIFLIAGIFLIGLGIAYAAPVGNIAKPAMLKSAMLTKDTEKATIGVIGEGEFDFTYDREIKDSDSDSYYRFLGGKLGFVFQDRVILYGLLGGAYYEEEFTDQGSKIKIESETGLAWGVGATLLIYETALQQLDNSILRFGIDGRFRNSNVDINKIIVDGVEYTLPSSGVSDVSIDYNDWQVAAEVSLQWQRFIPYFGVKYSDLDATLKSTVNGTTYEDSDVEPKNQVGIFVGADILVLDSMSLNVEGRFIDETALTLGCAVRF